MENITLGANITLQAAGENITLGANISGGNITCGQRHKWEQVETVHLPSDLEQTLQVVKATIMGAGVRRMGLSKEATTKKRR